MKKCKDCCIEKEDEKFRLKVNYKRKKKYYKALRCNDCENVRRRKKNPKTGPYAVHIGKGRGSFKYKEWKKSILERDGHKCVKCGNEKHLHCDHIIPWKEKPELCFELSNGQTLCAGCHLKKGKENNEIDGSRTQFKKGSKGPKTKFAPGLIPWIAGKNHSEETKEKYRKAHLGKSYSPKTEFKKGMIPWNKGLNKDKI